MIFIHTADWQLGSRFSQFASQSESLREARFKTLQRTLDLASEKNAEFFLIAGDLFEDNQVAESIVARAMDLLGSYTPLKIFLLPGNHDPYTGPGCVWNRPSVLAAAQNIHVFREPGCVELSQGYLLASPIQQKQSTIDPSLKLDQLVSNLDENVVKIGMTHGSIAIDGMHQNNDFPIHPEAASRGGLNYLAVGHWHGWITFDDGKIVMPGSPEPDRFAQENSGHVAVVKMDETGAFQIEKTPVATLRWMSQEVEFQGMDDEAEDRLRLCLQHLPDDKSQCIIRLILKGRLSPSQSMKLEKIASQSLESYLFAQVQNRIQPALTEAELRELRSRSPLLAQIMNDLAKMESYITGNQSTFIEEERTSMTLQDYDIICKNANLSQNSITEKEINRVRQLILQNLSHPLNP